MVGVRNIIQKDAFHFTIEWDDDFVDDYKLSDLQRNCPCAGCIDEITGKKLLDVDSIDENVKAIRFSSVGRYAIRLQFTKGCSNGIYSFTFLRKMSENKL